jgi:hypothetical protein
MGVPDTDEDGWNVARRVGDAMTQTLFVLVAAVIISFLCSRLGFDYAWPIIALPSWRSKRGSRCAWFTLI